MQQERGRQTERVLKIGKGEEKWGWYVEWQREMQSKKLVEEQVSDVVGGGEREKSLYVLLVQK